MPQRSAAPALAALFLTLASPLAAQQQPLPPIEMTQTLAVNGPSEGRAFAPWFTAFATGDGVLVPMVDLQSGRAEGRLFDLATGTQTGTLPPPGGSNSAFFSESVARSARYVAMQTKVTREGRLYNAVYAYSLPDLTLRHVFDVPAGEDRLNFGIGGMAIAGDRLAISSAAEFGSGASGTLFMYDLTSGAELFRITDPDAPSGLFSVFQSYNDLFPGSIAMTDTHLAVTADTLATGAARVMLFDPETGALIRRIEKPQQVGRGHFGLSVALDAERLYVGASQKTTVRILLSTYATVGEVYALSLSDNAVLYKLDDPMPVAGGTQTAAYAAATGGAVPFYGSGFGNAVRVAAGKLYVDMPNFAQPVSEAGATAVYDAATGKASGLIQSAQPGAQTNFGVVDVMPDGAVIGFSRAYKETGQPTKLEVLRPN